MNQLNSNPDALQIPFANLFCGSTDNDSNASITFNDDKRSELDKLSAQDLDIVETQDPVQWDNRGHGTQRKPARKLVHSADKNVNTSSATAKQTEKVKKRKLMNNDCNDDGDENVNVCKKKKSNNNRISSSKQSDISNRADYFNDDDNEHLNGNDNINSMSTNSNSKRSYNQANRSSSNDSDSCFEGDEDEQEEDDQNSNVASDEEEDKEVTIGKYVKMSYTDAFNVYFYSRKRRRRTY